MLLVGCSDDKPLNPDNLDPDPTTIDIVIDTERPNFDLRLIEAQSIAGPVNGSFTLHGRNVRYNGGYKLLLVDLTVYNTSSTQIYGPVSITFNKFFPDSVTMWDPPEGKLTWEFTFDYPGSRFKYGVSSEVLTVGFSAERGQTIRFLADLGVAPGPPACVVEGVVWNDLNQNGNLDPGEGGMSGIPLTLSHIADGYTEATYSGTDGSYRFENLAIGQYDLALTPVDHASPTTAVTRTITLDLGPDGYDQVAGEDFGALWVPVPEVMLNPNADTTVRAELENRQGANYGADPYLRVGTTLRTDGPVDAIRSLLRFDVPADLGTVVSARLEMSLFSFPYGSDQTFELGVHAIIDSGDRTPWEEGNGSDFYVNFIDVWPPNAARGVAWIGTANGGDASNTTQPDFAATASSNTTIVPSEHSRGDVITWELTDLVNGWIDGSVANHGLLLRDTNPDRTYRQVWFGSRDGPLRYEDRRTVSFQPAPRLVLIYE